MQTSKNKKQRTQVEFFLSQLEKRGRILVDLAAKLENEAATSDVTGYRPFRDEVDNFKGLSIIISDRLSAMADDGRKQELEQQFHRLQVLMLRLVIKASLKFFFVMSAKSVLPLGAKELFQSELKTLYDAEKMLSDPVYESDLDEGAREDLETAKEILEEIIRHAPALLDFGKKRKKKKVRKTV